MTIVRLLALSPLAALAACAGPLNNEPGIGNAGRTWGHSVYTPATLAEGLPPAPAEGLETTIDQKAAPVYGASGPIAAAAAEPSLVSLDRDNWAATSIAVPNDFPAHQPRFATNYIDSTSDPRAKGKYPDERTALGTATTRHNNQQFVEAIVAPAVAGADVVMMIPRMIAETRPMESTRTGGQGYERAPRQVTIMNPTAETVGGLIDGDPSAPPGPATPPNPTTTKKPAPLPPSGAPRIIRPIVPGQQPPADETPAENLRPGGGMPASDIPSGKR